MPDLPIFTLGHSDHAVPDFLKLLRRSGVRQLADVRRHPASRRHPHFNRDTLEYVLNVSWVAYRHVEDLGGRREAAESSPHTALTGWQRGYADHMDGDAFHRALDELVEWSRAARTAVLCAEADPLRCHRHLLSDALVARGVRVVHILDEETLMEHQPSALARFEDGRVVYDAGALRLDL